MKNMNEMNSAQSGSRPFSFRLAEDDRKLLEQEAGQRSLAASEYARAIVLGRHETQSRIRALEGQVAEAQHTGAVLSRQLSEIRKKQEELQIAKETLKDKLTKTEVDLAEAVKYRDHLQEAARAAQRNVKAIFATLSQEFESVANTLAQGLKVLAMVLGLFFCTLLGSHLGPFFGGMFLLHPIASVLSGVVILVALFLLTYLANNDEGLSLFPAVVFGLWVVFCAVAFVGLIWRVAYSFSSGPDYQVN